MTKLSGLNWTKSADKTITLVGLQRFWAKVDRRGAHDCWPWKATRLPKGYGRFGGCYAHQFALVASGRERPDGAIALHACNNPPCVNPAHLRWGTHKENMRQAIESGRAPHEGRVAGEKNGNAKLTEDDVRAIRADPRPHNITAQDYGVSPALISHVRHRRSWRHVL